MGKNDRKIKLFLLFFGLLLGLLVAEIGVRVYKYAVFQSLDELEFGDRPAVVQPGKELTLGQIIQISSVEDIIYELIPNSAYQFMGVSVRTNSLGFRDRDYPPIKSKNSKRVIGIGDSSMFGWGVEEEDCYLSRIETQLNATGPDAVDIINTAVPGYNTVMEVAVLEHKIQLDQVDLVVINFIDNDFGLPSFIRESPDFLSLQKSFVLMLLEDTFIPKHRDYVRWLGVPPAELLDENAHVPARYQDMVGHTGYLKGMRRLKELSDTYGFHVMVLSQSPFTTVPDIVKNTCRELGFDLIDFRPYWEDLKKQNPALQWKLSEHDWHPTAVGHREVAKVLGDSIRAYFTP